MKYECNGIAVVDKAKRFQCKTILILLPTTQTEPVSVYHTEFDSPVCSELFTYGQDFECTYNIYASTFRIRIRYLCLGGLNNDSLVKHKSSHVYI